MLAWHAFLFLLLLLLRLLYELKIKFHNQGQGSQFPIEFLKLSLTYACGSQSHHYILFQNLVSKPFIIFHFTSRDLRFVAGNLWTFEF